MITRTQRIEIKGTTKKLVTAYLLFGIIPLYVKETILDKEGFIIS